ncbi:MAG: NAD(+)/NADH kinase [Campylobacterales bacterium]|nr:NAD(+)/NADH kinase [Campylobacterales bacterium]
MKILSLNKAIQHEQIEIDYADDINEIDSLKGYDFIIIKGGDGTIRRGVAKAYGKDIPPLIIDASGSFNVVAKYYKLPKVTKILDDIAKGNIKIEKHRLKKLNDEIFLFSAGNMGDVQHIAVSENLRSGFLKDGIGKYLIAFIFLLPLHIFTTPWMLFMKDRFFIFDFIPFIKKIGNFYGVMDKPIKRELSSEYNFVELDGDIVVIKTKDISIEVETYINIVSYR